MDSIKNVPEGLSKELKEIFVQFPKQVKRWKRFLKDLGYFTFSLDDYNKQDEGVFEEGNGIIFKGHNSQLTLEDAIKNNLIIAGMGYYSLQQFTANEFWPYTLSSNCLPCNVEVRLYINDKAEVLITPLEGGNDISFFDKNKYFGESNCINGRWDEIAQILFEIRTEVVQKLKLNDPPSIS